MLTAIHLWQEALSKEIKSRFGLELPPAGIPFTFPPKPELGDAATPVCFALAKRLKRAPQQIAGDLAAVKLKGVRETRSAGGYLNLFVDRAWALDQLLNGRFVPAGVGGKVIVEHTNINPNKAAHVGHLRNAVLGDTLVRCLRFLNRGVEVQNYIDDTGVQVADVVVGFERILGLKVSGVKTIIRICASAPSMPDDFFQDQMRAWENHLQSPSCQIPQQLANPQPVISLLLTCLGRFDSFCWDLYAKVAPWYEQCEENKKARFETLHLMEEGNNETAEMAALIAEEMVRCHLRTMERLGIRYDVLPHESDILKIGFWTSCFEKLKQSGAVHKVPDDAEEKNRGCWVMALADSDEFRGMSDADKVIVRSNGTVTYIGKDMAYQLWKFGLLGRDFHYRRFDAGIAGYPPIWRTGAAASDPGAPSFGAGEAVVNVIDVRQSYLQKIVKEGLRQMGHACEAEKSVHFAYEMVALSQKAAAEFENAGQIKLSGEDKAKPFVEMSGRKGLGVQAGTLLDLLERKASHEIRRREVDLSEDEAARRAKTLAAAALRYYMLKYGKNQVVAFDFDQALAFEGETGPYLQYACVRAENILRKARNEHGFAIPDPAGKAVLAELAPLFDEEAWAVLTRFLRVPVQVKAAVDGLDLNLVARQFYEAAQAFHAYYHAFPVLQEPDERKRAARLLTVALFAHLLRRDLNNLLGIPVPERM